MDNNVVNNGTSESISKTSIKNFAVYSRNKLIKDIKNKAALIGITESGIKEPLSFTGNIQLFDIGTQEPYRIEGKAIEQRNALIRELKSREKDSAYETTYKALIEEVAYTWFNRIIAIRFMEVNNYMPDRMRVLSSGVEGINEPEFITHVFETSFEFSEEEKKRIIELKMDGSNLAMDELFQYLFIKQCNSLNTNLPELFEKTNDYTELMLTVSYNDVEGVIYKLVHELSEADFDVNSENGNGQVEIIGWLYQFYNTEPKAAVDKAVKAKKKVSKFQLPAKTQLFTPKWIVKYMVENSLGRVWIGKLLANGDSRTEKQIAGDFGWKYYLPEAEQEEGVRKQLKDFQEERKHIRLEEITFLDPAMGSFHIGIYAFEVYMQIYESEGYTARESAKLIIEKNLHGIDIDKRAAQLSYFACMMQARKYNRRILEEKLQPKVYEIVESNHINVDHLNYLGNDINDKQERIRLKLQLISLLNNLNDAKEYGSLINISDTYEFLQLRNYVNSLPADFQISLLETVGLEETQKELLNIINVAEIISKKYDVVITNPPYMGNNGMDKKLSDFAKKYYPDSKSDMFAMFIEKCEHYTAKNGYFSMITQHAWMFLSSYKKLRSSLLMNTLVNMAHLGPKAFEEIGGEVVQTTSFVYLNSKYSDYIGKYVKLTEFDSHTKKEVAYLDLFNSCKNNYLYETNQEYFKKIPGSPIAYWASLEVFEIFDTSLNFEKAAKTRAGMITGNNDLFIRLWYEVDSKKIGLQMVSREESVNSKKKWFPYNKGGEYRKWYGNNEYVVNWENDGLFMRNYKNENGKIPAHAFNLDYIFKRNVTWNSLSSYKFSARFSDFGFLYDASGSFADIDSKLLYYIIGFLCSNLCNFFLSILNPTLNYQKGNISNLPLIISKEKIPVIESLVKQNIDYSKEDWDYYETSWDFNTHPLLLFKDDLHLTIKTSYEQWKGHTTERRGNIKDNEERINKIFNEIYELPEIKWEVLPKDVTIQQANQEKDIKSFISYAVGCMVGRYSIDESGLIFAGGVFDLSKYKSFSPTKDNILILSDDEYLSDNILDRFINFLSICYGKQRLEENLKYIADVLGNSGDSPRSIIRNYFINEFYIDHVKMYQKRPIYWLYDSGKQNGFKALIYMHRYDEDTTGKVRVEYLHQAQKAYERIIANLQEDIVNSKDAKEITQMQKRIEKLIKQLKECKEYDEKLGHMALERIPIDLDDGVKVNYQKVQTDSKGKVHQILAEIK